MPKVHDSFLEARDGIHEFHECHTVGRRAGMYDEIDRRHAGKNLPPTDLTESPLQAVPFNSGMRVFRNNESDARVVETRKGSNHPNVEVFGSESLPFSCDLSQLGAMCDATPSVKRLAVTRRRTCWGVARSNACGLSYGGVPIPHAPTCLPYEHESRESSHGACCGGGRLAYP